MRYIFGVREADKETANQILQSNGFGSDVFSCKVKNFQTQAIGYVCSWILTANEESKVSSLLGELIIKKGEQPLNVPFKDLLTANGYEQVFEDI